MNQTGRYRFRCGWFGARVLQAEWVDDDLLEWRDVERALLRPSKVFAIVRPSEWEGFQTWRAKPAPRKRKPASAEAEVSRFA